MRKLLYIVFFISSFAQSQMVIDNYKFAVAAPSYVYQGDNAADPENEVNGTAGTSTASGEITWTSVTTPTPTDGSYALKATVEPAGSSFARGYIELTGVTSGQNVTVAFDADEVSGTWQVKLRLLDGDFDTDENVNIISGFSSHSMTSTASINNPRMRVSTASGTGANCAIDNIVITVN